MLIKLLPEQIARYWDTIKQPLLHAIPGEMIVQHGLINNALDGLLSGALECWWYVEQDKEDGESIVLLQVLTTIFTDNCTKLRTLRIYDLYGFTVLQDHVWEEGLRVLSEYALGIGCNGLDFFTQESVIIQRAKQAGFNTSFTYGFLKLGG